MAFLLVLLFPFSALAFDFSLKSSGPCNGGHCREVCHYAFEASGSGGSGEGSLDSLYTSVADGVSAQVTLKMPGTFLGQEDLIFDPSTGLLKTYYYQLRQIGRGMKKMKIWARVDFSGAVGTVSVIRATNLEDFDKEKAQAAAAGMSASSLADFDRQKLFATKYWSNDLLTAEWRADFDSSTPRRRLDMDLAGYRPEILSSPIYFSYVALRFMTATERQNFTLFTVSSINNGPHLIDSNLSAEESSQAGVRWKSQMKIAGANLHADSTMDQSGHSIQSSVLTGSEFIFSETMRMKPRPQACSVTSE